MWGRVELVSPSLQYGLGTDYPLCVIPGPYGVLPGESGDTSFCPCTPFLILDTAVCQQCIVALFSTCGSWVPPVSLKDSSLRGDGGIRMPTSLR